MRSKFWSPTACWSQHFRYSLRSPPPPSGFYFFDFDISSFSSSSFYSDVYGQENGSFAFKKNGDLEMFDFWASVRKDDEGRRGEEGEDQQKEWMQQQQQLKRGGSSISRKRWREGKEAKRERGVVHFEVKEEEREEEGEKRKRKEEEEEEEERNLNSKIVSFSSFSLPSLFSTFSSLSTSSSTSLSSSSSFSKTFLFFQNLSSKRFFSSSSSSLPSSSSSLPYSSSSLPSSSSSLPSSFSSSLPSSFSSSLTSSSSSSLPSSSSSSSSSLLSSSSPSSSSLPSSSSSLPSSSSSLPSSSLPSSSSSLPSSSSSLPSSSSSLPSSSSSSSSSSLPSSSSSSSSSLPFSSPLSPSVGFDNLPSIRRFSRSPPGQTLHPATAEDIEILSQSSRKYPEPIEVEGGVIIRLVRLCDPVTSPVGRVIRNRQYGIRGNERWYVVVWGAFFSSCLVGLGFWQMYRVRWKRELLELRRSRLSLPRSRVLRSPFPWTDNMKQWAFRTVEVRGVFDLQREMYVGPRPGYTSGRAGYMLVCPLLLEDGSTLMVNRGHCDYHYCSPELRGEIPEWVTVRGVLDPGEMVTMMMGWKRIKNHPLDRKFVFLEAEDLAKISGARNLKECGEAFLTAYDVMYDDDIGEMPSERKRRRNPRKSNGMIESPSFSSGAVGGRGSEKMVEMKRKEDYLIFWADEHTHFNYAVQWFLMATVTAAMTLYKFIEVTKWKF